MRKYLYLLLVLTLAVSMSACGRKKNNQVEGKKLPLVKTTSVKGEYFEETYKVVGIVKPFETAKISSEEGGLITWLSKDKGDRVGRGEVVVKLKKDVDEAAYLQALAQYELTKETFERTERLYKDAVATEQQFTTSKLQMEIALKAVELYKVRLSKGYVQSPISGVVEAKFMNKGEMTGPGIPILSIVNIAKVKISCGIPERYLTQISKGESVKITFDVLPDEEFKGLISYVGPSINSVSRTFEIEVILDNSDRRLKPEMSSNITFTNLKVDNAVVLPQDYVVDNGDEKFVFVLEGDIAKKKVIKVGGRSDNKVLVQEGLSIGETLINVGFQGLNDGDKVSVVN
ncbi:MAG: efflux RND transporter periplasmic adaptor subunit [Ignavibacteriae bacterium]|nr:efflux RND transporter periplasmic adaptor subunit [Ignavibacteriota bacterium]